MTKTRLPFGISKNIAALILLGAAIALFMLLKATRPDAQVESNIEPIFTVRTATVTPGTLPPSLSLYGTVTAPGRSGLTAALSADVMAVHKLPGDHADRGEILIELDPAEADIALSQARADLQHAEAQLSLDKAQRINNERSLIQERKLLKLSEDALARAQRLRAQGLLSEADLDAARQNLERQTLAVQRSQLAVDQADAVTRQRRASLSSAEARLQRAELDLHRTRIRAPFDAAVLATHVAVGDRVNPGQALIELYDTSRIEIRAQIPSRYLPALSRARKQGGNSQLQAVALHGGERLAAKFVRLASRADGGGQDAYFQLIEGELPIDARLTLELQLPPVANAVALPFDAIYDLSRIFRVRDGRLEALDIETLGDYLAADDNDAAHALLVRAPALQAGDQVVISQLPNAMTGLKVRALQ